MENLLDERIDRQKNPAEKPRLKNHCALHDLLLWGAQYQGIANTIVQLIARST
jgi:hypothetical protein